MDIFLAFFREQCHRTGVDSTLRYRGRDFTSKDVESIKALIRDNPKASRRALSFLVCEAWDWRQANGNPRDMVCRGALLALHRAGEICLPPPRIIVAGPPPRRKARVPVEIERTPLIAPLGEIGEIEIRQVRRTPDEFMVESLIEQHHYLGYLR